jgi:hypothetical protein
MAVKSLLPDAELGAWNEHCKNCPRCYAVSQALDDFRIEVAGLTMDASPEIERKPWHPDKFALLAAGMIVLDHHRDRKTHQLPPDSLFFLRSVIWDDYEPRALPGLVVPPTFEELIVACGQDGRRDFSEKLWPLEPVMDDEVDWKMVEYHFNDTVDGTEGLRRLDELAKEGKIRLPAGSRRAMQWIAANPNVQVDHRVILPLSAKHPKSYQRCLPVFFRWNTSRTPYLRLSSVKCKFNSHCGWLVLVHNEK